MRNLIKNLKNIKQNITNNENRQKEYLLILEKTCEVNKPIFIDRNSVEWIEIEKQIGINVWQIPDSELKTAIQTTKQNIVGRYRIDGTNSSTVKELWFDIDCNKHIETEQGIKNEWKNIQEAGKKLLTAINSLGITDEYIQIKASGRGLQFSVFCKGFKDEQQYMTTLKLIMQLSGLPLNIQNHESKGYVWGLDSGATASTRRKVREIGGQNVKLKNFVHYTNIIDLNTKTYPFTEKDRNVNYPTEIKIFNVDKNFVNKLHEYITTKQMANTEEKQGAVIYNRSGNIEELYKCPAIAKIAKNAENGVHITNQQRIFLSQTFTFFGEKGEQEIHKILKHDPDYNETYTQNQIENVKKCNRKPITCEWAKNNAICPECAGIPNKTPIALAWKPPSLEELRNAISRHIHLVDSNKDVIDFLIATGIERKYNPQGDAVWAYIVGASGSGKTEMMRLMEKWRYTYTIDELTQASFISGYKPEEGKYGIFEEFNNKTVYVKDMSDMLTGNKDERNAIFGKLRNAYDGYLEKGFGTMKT
ncbi:MAG: hypothetical protein NWE98_01970, partial [Candidatus Bathyarchaeota archaeon]|nr:hypothetical protein [Candidatus Bathyarchaeota archaeon]